MSVYTWLLRVVAEARKLRPADNLTPSYLA